MLKSKVNAHQNALHRNLLPLSPLRQLSSARRPLLTTAKNLASTEGKLLINTNVWSILKASSVVARLVLSLYMAIKWEGDNGCDV